MDYRIAICDGDGQYVLHLAGLAAQWAALAGAGAVVERFPSAGAFLFRYEEARNFDILLQDVKMGGMDGVELLKRVREQDDNILWLAERGTGPAEQGGAGQDGFPAHSEHLPVPRL